MWLRKMLLIVFLLPCFLQAQVYIGDVKFEDNITSETLQAAIAKARAENKYVFLLFEYSSNATQKYYVRRNEIVNKSSITNFIKRKFVCLYVKMYSNYFKLKGTDALNEDLVKNYHVSKAPTAIFLDGDGKAIHRCLFNEITENEMLKKLNNVFDENEQYYSITKKFTENVASMDSASVKSFFKKLYLLEYDNNDAFVLQYIKTRPNLFTAEVADVLINSYSRQIALDYLFNNQNVWRKIVDEQKLEEFYHKCIRGVFSNAYIFKSQFRNNIDSSIAAYELLYPGYGKNEAIIFFIENYYYTKNASKLTAILNHYVDSNFISTLNTKNLNSIAWDIFKSLSDTSLLERALYMSKLSLEKKLSAYLLDTYANLLYKLGRKAEAINYMHKAIELNTRERGIDSYVETLQKMIDGKPTW